MIYLGRQGVRILMHLQEEIMEEDPELGPQYKAYKMKVPWRLIPYVW